MMGKGGGCLFQANMLCHDAKVRSSWHFDKLTPEFSPHTTPSMEGLPSESFAGQMKAISPESDLETAPFHFRLFGIHFF